MAGSLLRYCRDVGLASLVGALRNPLSLSIFFLPRRRRRRGPAIVWAHRPPLEHNIAITRFESNDPLENRHRPSRQRRRHPPRRMLPPRRRRRRRICGVLRRPIVGDYLAAAAIDVVAVFAAAAIDVVVAVVVFVVYVTAIVASSSSSLARSGSDWGGRRDDGVSPHPQCVHSRHEQRPPRSIVVVVVYVAALVTFDDGIRIRSRGITESTKSRGEDASESHSQRRRRRHHLPPLALLSHVVVPFVVGIE